MKQIEVEGGEVVLKNSYGDVVIIPKDKVSWIEQKISEGCDECVDELVETLPSMKDYAEDGTIIKSDPPTGRLKKVINEVQEKYSYDWYVDNVISVDPGARNFINQLKENNPLKIDFKPQYEQYVKDLAAEKLIKEVPSLGKSKKDRLDWYNSFSNEEKALISESSHSGELLPGERAYKENLSDEVKKGGTLAALKDVDKMAKSVEGTSERFRLFPNATNDLESYLNPGIWAGEMAKGVGNIPKDIKEGNYGKAAASAAIPASAGALAGLGAKTTNQFLDNLVNPLAGMGGSPKGSTEELVDLYRIQEKNAKTFAQLAEENKIPSVFNNKATLAKKAEEEKYFGQWFTKDKADLDWYAKDREFIDPEIVNLKVPKSKLDKYSNYDKSLSRAPDREFLIPTNEQSLYKQIEDPKGKFESEIDWGKWNKEIPENKALMKEYNAIEQQAKADGTWMKNTDGSEFKGTPEQFVQQNSENFKKAFGKSKLINPDGSPNIQYHGSAKKFNEFDESMFQLGDSGYSGRGIYTTPSKSTASSYAKSSSKFHQGDINPTVYELYGKGNNPIRSTEAPGKDLFNFHRDKNWQGDITFENQMREYDVAIRNQRGGTRIAPDHDSYENVFPTNKQLKSAVGNNGMFDMFNPNIYKSLVPLLGVIEAIKASEDIKKKKNKK